MKIFSVSLLAGALMLANPSVGSAASTSPGGTSEVQDFCRALIASGRFPTANFGECISFNVTSDQGFVTKFCDFVRETADYADYGFTSYSDCVRSSR